ncbi:MAG: hypothetical protein F6K00_34580 [Leptolyngbya sp. SIOISBB]|nr:hypothetical protein [Leptolyngbya sp. SIOISBB]
MVPMTDDGYGHGAVVETWREKGLLKQLPAGSVIICDNASFHKGGRIEALIRQAGCHLLYLPPYSPDLHPIVGEAFAKGISVVRIEGSHAQTDSIRTTLSISR